MRRIEPISRPERLVAAGQVTTMKPRSGPLLAWPTRDAFGNLNIRIRGRLRRLWTAPMGPR